MSNVSEDDWAALQRGFAHTKTDDAKPGEAIVGQMYLQMAREHLVQAVPHAAATIAALASDASSERVRLQAAQYIIDRVMGVGPITGVGSKTPMEQLLDGVLGKIEDFANGEGGK